MNTDQIKVIKEIAVAIISIRNTFENFKAELTDEYDDKDDGKHQEVIDELDADINTLDGILESFDDIIQALEDLGA
jgi:hypothetical protein